MLGILLTMVDTRAKVTSEISDIIRKQFQQVVFNTEIKTNIKLAEAPSFGKTIFQYDWNSTGAEAYQSLAKEVIQRTKGKANNGQQEEGQVKKPTTKTKSNKATAKGKR